MTFKRKCYVHIGMHKTGSSSIQETLSKIKDLGQYYYADLKTPNHSGKIYSIFSDSKVNIQHLKKRGMTDSAIHAFIINAKGMLIDNCQKNLDKNMIISAEGIVRLSIQELSKFKDFLEEYFNEVYIIAYIRPAFSFLESSFQERVKAGAHQFDLSKDYPNYKKKFAKFDSIFGKDNVCLKKFDKASLKEQNVVIDFCAYLDISIHKNTIYKKNESISKEVLALLYTYYKHGPGYGTKARVVQENNRLIEALSSLGSSKLKFSSALKKEILPNIKEDIIWMEQRLGESLEENMENMDENIGCVEKESNFFEIEKNTLEGLKSLINEEYHVCGLEGVTPKEVALLIHCLRLQLIKSKSENKSENKNSVVLIGQKGYLFLNEVNQNVSDYFRGLKVPEDFSLQHFSDNLKERNRYCEARKIEYKHFVFPEKLYALRHLSDFNLSSLYHKFYQNLGIKNSHYFNFTALEAEKYYYKGDTHCNLYGYLNILLELLNIEEKIITDYIDEVKSKLRLKEDFRGDLAKKLEKPPLELIVHSEENKNIQIVSNGLEEENNGLLNILLNKEALYNKKILIFGDSFLKQMLTHISYFYREVIFCHTPFFHTEVADACSADIIFTGNAERYLSKVHSDKSRYHFFTWSMLEGRGSLPSNHFSQVMHEVFDFDKLKYLKEEE